MINKILDLVMRINAETEHAASFKFSGHVNGIEVRVAESKENFLTGIYWKDFYGEVDRKSVLKKMYEDLLSFLPKEKRPVTTPVEEKIIYHTILPQKEEELNEQ